METRNIADIDREIAHLEKDLSGLYHKRVILLEAEIHHYKNQINAFAGLAGDAIPDAPAPKATATTRARKLAQALATKKPAQQQWELFPEVPAAAPAPSKKKAAARKAKQPKKRTRTPTAVVEKKILDALKEAGLFGLSQIELSKKTALGYQTIVQKLKRLPSVAKKGSRKEARYFVKA